MANFVFGRHPVEELLETASSTVAKIYIKKSASRDFVDSIKALAGNTTAHIQLVPEQKLQRLVGQKANHQGIVAEISEIEYAGLGDWLESVDLSTKPFVVVLDRISDVHNTGAIIRSAAASGAVGVIVMAAEQAPINEGVIKASAGAVFKIPIVRGKDAQSTLDALKKKGFWTTGLDQQSDITAWGTKLTVPLAIFVGNEQHGLSKQIKNRCDFLLKFPLAAGIESLNVSVAAALLFYEIVRQREGQ